MAPRSFAGSLSFTFINFTWIFFRADNIESAMQMINRIFSGSFNPIQSGLYSAFYTDSAINDSFLVPTQSVSLCSSATPALIVTTAYFCFAFFAALNMKNTNERIETFKPRFSLAFISASLLCYAILSLSGVSTFLYFNF